MFRLLLFYSLVFFTQNVFCQTWQLGIDFLNSAAAEYHFENKLVAGLQFPSATEKTSTSDIYETKARLEYLHGLRLGWEAVTLEKSKGFLLLAMSLVKGIGTVNINNSANLEGSKNGESIVIKYNHRWYWQNYALGVGGGYRHNSITNVLVPHFSQTFDVKLEQVFGPLFGEVSLYLIF